MKDTKESDKKAFEDDSENEADNGSIPSVGDGGVSSVEKERTNDNGNTSSESDEIVSPEKKRMKNHDSSVSPVKIDNSSAPSTGDGSVSPIKKNIKEEIISPSSVKINKPITCYLCDKVFRFNVALDRHMQKVHQLNNQHNTDDLSTIGDGVEMTGGERYVGKEVYKIDGEKADRPKSQGKSCTKGNKKIEQQVKKKSGKLKKTQMEFSCSICKKSFSARLSLITHLQTCNNESGDDSAAEDSEAEGSIVDVITVKEPLKKRETMYIERQLKGDYKSEFLQYHANSAGNIQ